MTPEVEKKRRELFEAHLKQSHPDDYAEDGDRIFKREGAGYDWHWVNEFWLCFNAALDAVEIELPHDRSLSASDDPWQVKEWCAEAITATGLGLRIK